MGLTRITIQIGAVTITVESTEAVTIDGPLVAEPVMVAEEAEPVGWIAPEPPRSETMVAPLGAVPGGAHCGSYRILDEVDPVMGLYVYCDHADADGGGR